MYKYFKIRVKYKGLKIDAKVLFRFLNKDFNVLFMKIFCMSDTHTGGRAQPNHWYVCKVIFEKVSVILTETIVNIIL